MFDLNLTLLPVIESAVAKVSLCEVTILSWLVELTESTFSYILFLFVEGSVLILILFSFD